MKFKINFENIWLENNKRMHQKETILSRYSLFALFGFALWEEDNVFSIVLTLLNFRIEFVFDWS